MFCQNCGNKINDDVKFCSICGAKTEGKTGAQASQQPQQPQPQPQPPVPAFRQPPMSPVPQVPYDPAGQPGYSGRQPQPQPAGKKSKKGVVIAVLLIIAVVAAGTAYLVGRQKDGGGVLKISAARDEVISKVPATGGTVTVNDPQSPVNGLSIAVESGSYTAEKTFDIKTSTIQNHSFGKDFTPITPLITINNGGDFSAKPVKVSIPIQLATNEFAMAFYLDRQTGKLEALPFEDVSASKITVVTNHFSEIVVSKILISELQKLYVDLSTSVAVDTGFTPGIDDWQFTNYGSLIAPGGHCAGQSLTMAWYYFEKHLSKSEPSLFGRFDNNAGQVKTASFWQDDSNAYKFASIIQFKIDWDSMELERYIRQSSANQAKTFYAFAYAMHLTGEPQFMGIYSYDNSGNKTGGHAIIAYKVEKGRIYVADPNYPGQKDRYVEFTGTGFKPYSSGANAMDISENGATLYKEIVFVAKTALVDFKTIEAQYASMLDGTIGSDDFPTVEVAVMKKYNENPELIEWEIVEKGEVTLDSAYSALLPAELKNYAVILASAGDPNFLFSLYEGITTVRLLEGMVFPEEEDGTVVFFVPLGSGANEFGILAEYVYEDSLFYGDFRRLKINYNVAGVSAARSYPAVTTGKTGTPASVPTQAPTQAPTAAAATAQATAAATQDLSGIYDLYERTDMLDVKTQYSFYYISLLKNGSYVEEAKTADGTVCGSNGTWSVSGDILSLNDNYGYTNQYKISGNTFASIGGDAGSPVFKFRKRF